MRKILIMIFVALVWLSCERPDIERVNKIEVTAISEDQNNVIAKGYILDVAGSGMFEYGNCYAHERIPAYSDMRTTDSGNGKGEINDTLINIISGYSYTLIPYIRKNDELFFGSEKEFSFEINEDDVEINSFDFNSNEPEEINVTACYTGYCSYVISNFGYDYKNTDSPYSDWINVDFNGTPSQLLSDSIFNVSEGDEYNIRFYLKPENSTTIYSETYSFVLYPIQVFTTGSMLLGSESVRLNGQILPGSYDVSDYGFCWSYTTSNPSLNEDYLMLGPGYAADFYADITNMQGSTTYYYRAFAMVGNRVYYGNVEQFATR